MTASEYRAKLGERAGVNAARVDDYGRGDVSGLLQAHTIARYLADPAPSPAATAEPGLERSGGRVWGESWKDFPKPADGPAVFLEESAGFYAGAADGVYHSDGRGKWTKVNEAAEATAAPVADVPAEVERLAAVNPFAAYEGFPVTVQEEGGPAITVPPGWRVKKQNAHNHVRNVWCAWLEPVGVPGPFPPSVPVPAGWRGVGPPGESVDHPGCVYVAWERVPAAEPSDGGSGKTFQTDPAAVRRAALLEAAELAGRHADRYRSQRDKEDRPAMGAVLHGQMLAASLVRVKLRQLAGEAG